MEIQKNDPSQVQGFDVYAYTRLIDSDFEGFFSFLESLSERKHTISKSGIGMERQLLFTWKKNGLLPFRATADTDKRTWNRFSFIELCWIKTLVLLRKQGVGVERLKQIKDQLFPENFHKEALSQLSHDLLGEKFSGYLKERGLKTDTQIRELEISRDFLDETQFSLFFCLLLSSLVMRANIVLYMDEGANPGIIDLDSMRGSPISGVVQAYDILNMPSVTTINITHIVTELTKTVDISTRWLFAFKTR